MTCFGRASPLNSLDSLRRRFSGRSLANGVELVAGAYLLVRGIRRPLAEEAILAKGDIGAVVVGSRESRENDVDDHHSTAAARGVISAIDPITSKITIQRKSGVLVDVTVDANTRIERNDRSATFADFAIGDWGEAKFDAAGLATKLEAKSFGSGENNGLSPGRARLLPST
jgi:hypothetical protein